MNINVTSRAEGFIRRMVRFGNCGPNAGFRLMVTTGGCSGLGSDFSIESAPREGDEILDVNGVKVFLPIESRALLDGATVDFRDSAMASGLAIVNPNLNECGCGGSGSGAGRSGMHATIDISAIQRKS
jgi:iron-sulfur cluster assembly accessory protein